METDRNSGSGKQGATTVQPSPERKKRKKSKKKNQRVVTLINKKNLSRPSEAPIILKVVGEGPKRIHGYRYDGQEFEPYETEYDKSEYIVVNGMKRAIKQYENWKTNYEIWQKWYNDTIREAEKKAKEWVYEQVVEYVLNHPKPKSPFASMIKPNKAKAKRGEQ
jgi:hypothetical protein